MEKLKKQRDIRLDIIRIFSLFTVVGVHFFLNSGFYDQIVSGKKMFVMCTIRSFFIICVPMFITLTGYLMNKKQLSKKYYKGIVKTLIIYLICSVIYSAFRKFYLNDNITIKTFIKSILDFHGTAYSWYIEMYIGLFLLIPFLNLIFNNLKSQKQANILLLTLIILIGVPSILNIFNFSSFEWWKTPSISNKYVKLFPEWWSAIYPIFYYFLGAYLSKYKINLNKKWNILLLVMLLILDGLFNFYRSYGSHYVKGTWNNYSSAIIMCSTFLVFNLLLNIKVSNNNTTQNRFLKTISDACLGGYLISCIFDEIYYNYLNTWIPTIKDRFIYAPIIVIAVFISSILLSIIINLLYKLFENLYYKCKQKIFNLS